MRKFLIFLILVFISCENWNTSSIEYEVSVPSAAGFAEVDITISNQAEGTEMHNNVRINGIFPWVRRFEAPAGQFLYLAAQNQRDHGTIVVKIKIDNDMYKMATSDGAYVVALVSGSVP